MGLLALGEDKEVFRAVIALESGDDFGFWSAAALVAHLSSFANNVWLLMFLTMKDYFPLAVGIHQIRHSGASHPKGIGVYARGIGEEDGDFIQSLSAH